MISLSDTMYAVLIISLALVAVISSATAIWYRTRFKLAAAMYTDLLNHVINHDRQIQAQRNAPKIPQPTKDQPL